MSDDTTPLAGPLAARFLRGVAVAPDRTAIRARDGALTYAELHERALRWAGALLRAMPDGPGAAVGVLAGKGLDAYTGILAGLYAGVTVVPLSTEFPAARTRQMLHAAGVAALVTDERGYELLPEILLNSAPGDAAMPVLCPSRAGGPFPRISADGAHELAAPRPVDRADPAYILFTSGSTGRPKGVPISHAANDHYFQVLDARYDFTPDDAFSQTFDLNFDCAMFDMFCAWGAGACLVQVPASAYRDMPAFMARAGLTVWFSTPSAIALVRRTGGLAPAAMPGLRWSFFAGEALKCRDADDWQQAAPTSAVENLYGPTELTITCTAHRWDPEASPPRAVNGVVPIGGLHKGLEYLLLGPDGEPADGEGELCVSGPQMTTGYLDPADAEGRFVERGSLTWYRTGDRVREVGGELAYLDRMDAQVQVRGWRIEPAEIDNELRSCPEIEDAVTVAATAGTEAELVGFYTGRPVPAVELARRLRRTLPEPMIPRRFAHLAGFPLNPNRKIDRSALLARANVMVGGSAAP
ncbi:AMP-binding protein [Actinomadura sp. 7K507]|uniref:AMP-binding protein n=1 Tax=Actinomadura sp. 7K507 TaxID=2530365 RepID=UPI001044E28C|nr:AMP-binding protein [Actinomadura sp. 7K507]TDC86367.1 D-alanine--poly(phosphoribitol) ligase [Actinomadura sp. 7K507]